MLDRLDPTNCALLSRVSKPWLAAVVSRDLPRTGKGGALPLMLKLFVGSAQLLAWGKDHGCPWTAWSALVAAGGHLAVLQWAREHGCEWDAATCPAATRGGHLEVLQWAREQDCPWCVFTCANAALGGHLAVLQWAREHNCEWDEHTCIYAAMGGRLELMHWAWEHGCDWIEVMVRESAAEGGHQEKLAIWLAGPHYSR